MNDPRTSPLSQRLATAPAWAFSAYAIVAAFGTYFCMYGFRKAFAAASYADQSVSLFGAALDLKLALVTGQVLGYALSKVLGIKFNSESGRGSRARRLVQCILVSFVGLIIFALLPGWGRVLGIFISALPLGMVWGLVFSFLEGRRLTDLLGAGLCCSFIIASAFAKSVGTQLMNSGVPEAWMPAAAGACYFPFFLIAVWMLRRIPHPTEDDIADRVERRPMDKSARRSFYGRHAFGLTVLMVVYVLLTVCRDFRDNFAPEMFAERGITNDPAIFVKTETPIAFTVVLLVGLLFLIRDNRKALLANHLYAFTGAAILLVSTLLFDSGRLDIAWWMVVNGFGLFLAYVPFNCIFFDRLVAHLNTVATSVFLIYIADSSGYLAVVALMLYKNFGDPAAAMLDFYRYLSYASAVLITIALATSWFYFKDRGQLNSSNTSTPQSPQ